MAAGKHNFKLEQGTTWDLQLTVVDDSDAPINLTGHEVRMMMRVSYSARLPVVSLSTATSGITVDAPNGVILLALTAAQTAALPARELVYDVEIENPSGRVQRVLQGTCTVTPEVTHD